MSGPLLRPIRTSPPISGSEERGQEDLDGLPRCPPVTLVQPPSLGRVSGGYLFNREMMWRLTRDGLGETLDLHLADLDRVASLGDRWLVLDSLYLNQSPGWAENGSSRRNPRAVALLLHYVPSSDPGLEPRQRVLAEHREELWFRNVEKVITTSRLSADHVAACTAMKAHVVQPGVSHPFRTKRQGPSKNSIIELVTVGSVCEGKNQLFVLECLARADSQNFRWHVVGDRTSEPDYVARLEEGIRRLGLGDRVRLRGPLPHSEIAALMNRSHLYVSGSLFESYGMATAEAVCHGIPALCFDVGASREWIGHGRNGQVYDREDLDGFRAGLSGLLSESRSLRALESGSQPDEFPTWEQSYRTFVRALTETR